MTGLLDASEANTDGIGCSRSAPEIHALNTPNGKVWRRDGRQQMKAWTLSMRLQRSKSVSSRFQVIGYLDT